MIQRAWKVVSKWFDVGFRTDALVFVLSAIAFGYIQWHPSFVDPDSFYHAKMAELTWRHGLVRDFVWLPFTTLAKSFADHHYLYHLILAPFVGAFGMFVGTKIATVLLAALAVVAFRRVLLAYGAAYSLPFTLLLATCGGFIFRLNLAKASALSITLACLTLIAWRRERSWLLFPIAWLFVWSYGGWPLVLIIAACFWLAKAATFVVERHAWAPKEPSAWRATWTEFWRGTDGWRKWTETKSAIASAGGIIAGLVVNPYFPTNLRFYWEQIVQIAVLGKRGVIAVGVEWYPYTFAELYMKSAAVFLAAAIAVIVLLAAVFWGRAPNGSPAKRDAVGTLASFLLATTFLFLALDSRRHLEYFVPFALWFVAIAITRFRPFLTDAGPDDDAVNRRRIMKFVAVYLAVIIPVLGIRDIVGTRMLYVDNALPWTRYDGAIGWLKENAPDGAVVFTSEWDDFPIVFAKADGFRMVSGLDPTFLYRQDAARQARYYALTHGEDRSNPAAAIRDEFDSRFVLIETDHVAMLKALATDPLVTIAYTDDEATIVTIRTE